MPGKLNIFSQLMSEPDISQFDLRRIPDGFVEDPYPWYAALQTHDPVHHCPDGSWLLTRYWDLKEVYKDGKIYSSDKMLEFGEKYGPTPLRDHHTTSLVFNDPPLHTRVRRLLVGALTNKAIAAMEPALIELVDRLLDELEVNPEVDLVRDFASAIPIEVIGNLLGVPHADRGPLRGWSLAILGALEPTLTPEQEQQGNDAVTEFSLYLKDFIAERRANPRDSEKDVLTRLIQGEENGEKLTEFELIHNCIFILNAGHETTTNLIANALHALTMWRGQRRLLLEKNYYIDTAVDEFLRFESSNQLGNRISTADSRVGRQFLPAGSRITLCIGAANRDPVRFEDPQRLDITRFPNRHLAFGSGPHLCAGVSLARLEGQIAILRFLKRFPNYGLKGTPVRSPRIRFRGFEKLPVNLNC